MVLDVPFDAGFIETQRAFLPDAVVEGFAYVTHLGDPLFFLILVSVVFWLDDHDRGVFVVATTLFALGVTVALKEAFALPRPPSELHVVSASGYGLPSGHAVGAVVVYGLLAEALDVGTRRARYAVAGVLAALVSLSRVVLGVHYWLDVIAGVVLGCGLLALCLRYADGRSTTLFALAAGAGLLGAALSGLRYEAALLLFGAASGAALCCRFVRPFPAPPRAVTAACGVVVLPVVVGLVYAGQSLLEAPVALVVAAGIAIPLVLVTPHAADRIHRLRAA